MLFAFRRLPTPALSIVATVSNPSMHRVGTNSGTLHAWVNLYRASPVPPRELQGDRRPTAGGEPKLWAYVRGGGVGLATISCQNSDASTYLLLANTRRTSRYTVTDGRARYSLE